MNQGVTMHAYFLTAKRFEIHAVMRWERGELGMLAPPEELVPAISLPEGRLSKTAWHYRPDFGFGHRGQGWRVLRFWGRSAGNGWALPRKTIDLDPFQVVACFLLLELH